MIKIKNKHITVMIEKTGAEIKSIKSGDREVLWQGNPDTWERTAPTLFPFCGKFKDGHYIYNDIEYSCSPHGFARNTEFKVEGKSHNSVTLLLESDQTIKEVYPFDFEFRVRFTVTYKSLVVEYFVKNKGNENMYFSLGSHESYLCDERVENYDIIFKNRENLDSWIVGENGLLTNETFPVLRYSKILPLHDGLFEYDSLVFKNIVSKKLLLRDRTNGQRVKIEYPDCKYLVIWKIPKENYVCIEPWAGLPDNVEHNCILQNKEGIIKLKKGKTYKNSHRITILPPL